ncbi:uncharacterized protein CCOS01_10226 [Colletotrichum costaricense]|uniref:Uncharacterized protein n=1 Tax=Colletotrichum costaricense TaxID=1209916 RepID=A0AAI9YT04_9PEZI|nr:uncharacterized protein CCOS01_10226 [Colletotrichum costaricense]KAK1522514.1 hypothetical protein CCOS01_10226 [Colletotrichum costaricense]
MSNFSASDFDLPGFDLPDFDVPDFDMSNFGLSSFAMNEPCMMNFDNRANGNALNAFQWPDEGNLMAEFIHGSPDASPVLAQSPFQVDLDIIDDLAVAPASKEWMFDVMLNDVVPYRYHDHLRLFPDIEFYRTLLYNRPNRDVIWGFVTRFHEWISSVAASSPDQADEVVTALQHRALFHGWPGTISTATGSESHSSQAPSTQHQQDLVSPSTSAVPTPVVVSAQGSKAASQLPVTTEHQHDLLKVELIVAPVFQYKGIIASMDHFTELNDAYERHVKREAGAAPEDDVSWPVSAEQQQSYVQKLFGCITDLDDFFELRKARERLGNIQKTQQETLAAEPVENQRKRRRGPDGQTVSSDPAARPKGMSKTDWALIDENSTPVSLLEAVIHHRISAIEVELLCWRLLRCAMEQQKGYTMRPLWSGTRTVSTWEHFGTFSERWQSICNNLQDCKMIVHSLTRADWICKYAGAPSKERGAKLSNDLLNGRRDIQNQVGRDVIKEKTSQQAWTTSDNFEIRDKDGELISKGGHLGDKKRRQLALRSRENNGH